MMMHPHDGTLQALLDQEVPLREQEELNRHLRGCAECSRRLEELQGSLARVLDLLPVLDRPPPAGAHREFVRRRARSSWGPALRRAAVLLFFAATAAAAVPGSPVRDWLADRWRGSAAVAAGPEGEAGAAPVAASPAAPEPTPSISLRPTEGRMRVVLVRSAPGLRVRVALTADDRVRVSAVEGGTGVRFRTRSDRVEVVGGGPGEVRVEIPRAVRHFTLEVNGSIFLEKEGEQLRFPETPDDSAGSEIVFQVRP
jgi:hypothetical protein